MAEEKKVEIIFEEDSDGEDENITEEIKKLSSNITRTINKLKNEWKKSYNNRCKAINSIEAYTYPCIFGDDWRSLGENSTNFMNVGNLRRFLPQIELEVEKNKSSLLNAFSLRECILVLKTFSNKKCDDDCPVCLEHIDTGFILRCGHKFHHRCILTCIEQSYYKCSMCRRDICTNTEKSITLFNKFKASYLKSDAYFHWMRLNMK